MSYSLRPHGCSPSCSSMHGIPQARILEYVATPSPGDLPDPGINPCLLHWQADSLPLSHLKSHIYSAQYLMATPFLPVHAPRPGHPQPRSDASTIRSLPRTPPGLASGRTPWRGRSPSTPSHLSPILPRACCLGNWCCRPPSHHGRPLYHSHI